MTAPRSRHRSLSGFTLVELMIVVVILGILAAIAIPAFTRYVKKSKTAEATTNIAHLVTGEVTAYQRFADNDSARFIQALPTPTAMPTESKYPANPTLWTSDPNWAQLGFSIDGGHYYQYSTSLSGGGLLVMPNLLLRLREDAPSLPPSGGSGFSVTATGNLDGDDSYSQFTRSGTLVDGEIQLDRLSITSELE